MDFWPNAASGRNQISTRRRSEAARKLSENWGIIELCKFSARTGFWSERWTIAIPSWKLNELSGNFLIKF